MLEKEKAKKAAEEQSKRKAEHLRAEQRAKEAHERQLSVPRHGMKQQ